MYGAFAGFNAQNANVEGLFAWRPVPLSPSWLSLSEWMGSVGPGGSAPVPLTFRAQEHSPGEYRSTLVVEDTTGTVIASVPLTLVVEAGTPAEPQPTLTDVTIVVAPNPIASAGSVTLTLTSATTDSRVGVYDVLGRQAALLHAGPLPAGVSRFELDVDALRAGVYVVRVVAGGEASSAPFSVVR
jgi:hypothetical protein